MENNFGVFLKQKRQEKNLTQKELAKELFVSESAVSKWEKNVSHPDITLLPKLSEILGVTEHELITASIDNKSRDEKVQAKKWRIFTKSWDMFFYIAYAATLIPCFICDLAINKSLTWFWIVLSALILSFTFTNLPKLITKFRLILIPLSMYLSLCLLLGVCCIYVRGDWFLIPVLSVLLGLIIIFVPIYISKYRIFNNIKKYNDFVSIGIDFIMLNILLGYINIYTAINHLQSIDGWYFKIALPITAIVYIIINVLICVKFLKINKLLKTSIILFLIDIFMYIPPLFVKSKYSTIQTEFIDGANILNSNLFSWNNFTIQPNINCIICLTLLAMSILFYVAGVIKYHINKKSK